jgi:hypothetical protein
MEKFSTHVDLTRLEDFKLYVIDLIEKNITNLQVGPFNISLFNLSIILGRTQNLIPDPRSKVIPKYTSSSERSRDIFDAFEQIFNEILNLHRKYKLFTLISSAIEAYGEINLVGNSMTSEIRKINGDDCKSFNEGLFRQFYECIIPSGTMNPSTNFSIEILNGFVVIYHSDLNMIQIRKKEALEEVRKARAQFLLYEGGESQ